MKYIPNIITSLNLASGFIAIVLATNGDLTGASWLILAAMFFDFCDGLSARMLKAYSDIGRELDSLADQVSFGVAPALILFKLIDNYSNPVWSASEGIQAGFPAILYHLVPVLMPVCAGLRLARFNIDTTQATVFKGLPTPANALAVISLVLAANYSSSGVLMSFETSPVLLSAYSLILSILMVTRIPLMSLKVKNLGTRGNEGRYLLMVLIIIAFAVLRIAAAPLIIPLYILVS
ncbi:MAG: CDP-diacylglycerol--serine O-phosphatidyltransferase, partial [Bacteroidota bacterium]|nr:CDP-diacylglycerol--serine O-phosphatidyltransferase [Bacteroidota bacterium]